MTICSELAPIELVPGDAWDEIVEINGQDGQPIDLSNWTITTAVVRKRGGADVVMLVLDLSQLATGKIGISADAQATGIVRQMGNRYDLEIEGYPAGGSAADNKTLYFGPVIYVEIATTNIIRVNHVGFQGRPGLSAYELDVANGYDGTLEEWLAGLIGWTPVLAVAVDGARRVHQVVDWLGSGEVKPVTGLYVGATGLVADIAEAADIRGGIGLTGNAATIAVGTVTTLAPGQPATAVNAGTSGAAVINFGIPAGLKGDKGDAYETFGVRPYKSDGIALTTYEAEPWASANTTQTSLYAAVRGASDPINAAFDFYVEVAGVMVSGPHSVTFANPVALTSLSIAVGQGQTVRFPVTYMAGGVTEAVMKTYGPLS